MSRNLFMILLLTSINFLPLARSLSTLSTLSTLSPRLLDIAALALSPPPNTPTTFLDVCSDHALLPLHLSSSPSPFSTHIAIDISHAATKDAQKTLERIPQSSLQTPITIMQGDGLLPFLPSSKKSEATAETFTTAISGVGVSTILSIIAPSTSYPSTFPTFVLSPTNTKATNLRKLLTTLLPPYTLSSIRLTKELDRANKHRYYVALRFDHTPATYSCYILQSEIQSYCGVTTDVTRRLNQHNGHLQGGAKATRMNGPWKMGVVVTNFPDRSAAMKFEYAIKQTSSFEARRHLARQLAREHNRTFLDLAQTDPTTFILDAFENVKTNDPTLLDEWAEFHRTWTRQDQTAQSSKQ